MTPQTPKIDLAKIRELDTEEQYALDEIEEQERALEKHELDFIYQKGE